MTILKGANSVQPSDSPDNPAENYVIDLMVARLDQQALHGLKNYQIQYQLLKSRKDPQAISNHNSIDTIIESLRNTQARVLRLKVSPHDYQSVVSLAYGLIL